VSGRWTWHGGGIEAARRHFGERSEPWIDLSTGINPHAWPGAAAASVDWQRLPDEADLRALEKAAADYFGTESHFVCAVPGTEIGLRLAGDVLRGQASWVAPSYRTHGEMFEGTMPVLREEAANVASEVLILANPNNPDGRAQRLDSLLQRPGWLLIDEAFADANPEISIAARVGDERPLLVFRSFGKFFGLAGLRLGFVLGPEKLLSRFRAKLGAWPVSAAAIAIGSAAYQDADWIAGMRERLPRDAAALDKVLARHGLQGRGECPLFRLIETENASALFERLACRSILTRPFDYDPCWLRIGLPGNEAALARLDAALGDG
jgi:cobalamin biosynthetic protein CobC